MDLRENFFQPAGLALLALLRDGRPVQFGSRVVERSGVGAVDCEGGNFRRFAPDAGAPIFGHVFLLDW